VNNAIGVFDSGLGGLTVLRELQAAMPHEHFVYVADSKYAPYGNKDGETVLQRSLLIAETLTQTHHIKALVVACNTATAAAVFHLRETLDIPVIGMEPALKPAVEQSESGMVGILATENTLQSDKFSNLLDAHQHKARILTQPCAGLVEAIEQGELHSEKTKDLLASYVLPLMDEGVDTLVLGCTHYPWFEPIIRELVGDRKVLCGLSGGVDSSVAAALIHKAIGDNLTCVFVNNGLLRKGEAEFVQHVFRDNFHINLDYVDAENLFLDALAGVSEPEQKRKIIGNLFVEVFEKE